MMTLSSQPTLTPSRDRYDGDRARAEEGAELAERKHPAVQKSAREDQPRDADQDEQDARQRFGHPEKIEIEPVFRLGEQTAA